MSWIKNKLAGLKRKLNVSWILQRTRALKVSSIRAASDIWKIITAFLSVLIILCSVLGIYWSVEPDQFDVVAAAKEKAEQRGYLNNSKKLVVGYTTASTLHSIVETLLDKSGGFISNDILPPGLFMDNMPAWEFGALVQSRDLARSLRKEFSRSQSQSTEDVNLKVAEPQFNFDTRSWALPSSESEYRRGNNELMEYLDRLVSKTKDDAQFYARADNLVDWLSDVNTRLGSLSQRLSASVNNVDDIFYEARGASWALIHILRAVEVDFFFVLQDKNALVSLRQIISELEATQATVWSPIILKGSGFGILPNHSLVMASYISRANAAIIDLRNLLEQG